jgi:D-arabinono-1,4-lactone oxidase
LARQRLLIPRFRRAHPIPPKLSPLPPRLAIKIAQAALASLFLFSRQSLRVYQISFEMDPLVAAEVDRRAADGIPFRARPNHTHHTWARTFSSLPELYVQPETLAEVEKVVDLARRCRRRLVVTGCGHSPSHMTCTSSWLLNLDHFNRVHSVDAASRIIVADAGIRLYKLCAELDRHGLAMPNLGSINEQSIAGAISTGTHGSSARHGLLSESIVALKITLASGQTVACSASERPDLFRAALLSLGAVGVVVEVSLRAVPAFSLRWRRTVDADFKVLDAWNDGLWTSNEFARVWWMPVSRRAVVWVADTSNDPHTTPPSNWFDGNVGYLVYHNLLALAQYFPRINPWIEWFVGGMQFGFRDGSSVSAVQSSNDALLLNCLYSQFVNEWALPLHRGPEALRRLSSWINRLDPDDPDYVPHGIPFPSDGLYIHSPIEVRVSDSSLTKSPRPFLDPTVVDGPTLYLNATLYRPYLRDPPGRDRFYQAFEWLMKDMGGRPHWAKNFATTRPELEALFGKDLDQWRRVRDEVDPEGMFVGPWHRERVMAQGPKLPLEEVEISRQKAADGGVLVTGST